MFQWRGQLFTIRTFLRSARHQYDELRPTTRDIFIPFDEALAMLVAFTDQLNIPEN